MKKWKTWEKKVKNKKNKKINKQGKLKKTEGLTLHASKLFKIWNGKEITSLVL